MTFIAHEARVWRKSAQGWDIIPADVAPKLLAVLQADAANPADWFHKRAAELAAELTAAITEAKSQRVAA